MTEQLLRHAVGAGRSAAFRVGADPVHLWLIGDLLEHPDPPASPGRAPRSRPATNLAKLFHDSLLLKLGSAVPTGVRVSIPSRRAIAPAGLTVRGAIDEEPRPPGGSGCNPVGAGESISGLAGVAL